MDAAINYLAGPPVARHAADSNRSQRRESIPSPVRGRASDQIEVSEALQQQLEAVCRLDPASFVLA